MEKVVTNYTSFENLETSSDSSDLKDARIVIHNQERRWIGLQQL